MGQEEGRSQLSLCPEKAKIFWKKGAQREKGEQESNLTEGYSNTISLAGKTWSSAMMAVSTFAMSSENSFVRSAIIAL